MPLIPITGRAFYLPGANNLGVVATGDGGAIAIDTGLDKDTGRALRKAVDEAGLRLRAIINTHHHADHIGGNDYLLRNLSGIEVFAPPLEAALIMHPILEPVYLSLGARPPSALQNKWLLSKGSPVHHLIEGGQVEVAGVRFEVVPLPGHSINQIGVAIDGVCFAADGYFGTAVLDKHGIPYAHDIAAQLTSLDTLAAHDDAFFLPGHGDLLPRADLQASLHANRATIERGSATVRAALEQPGDIGAVTARVLRAMNHTVAGLPQYAIFASAVAAHLSYLEAQGIARPVLHETGDVVDGKLTVETTLRVRYAETDAQGIVHHSSYIVWFEVGRSELLRARGTSYREVEAAGFMTVISDLQVRYHAAARYDDLLVVRTTLAELRSRQFTFEYEIVQLEGGVRLVTGRSTHVVLERASGRPTRLPQVLLALLGR